MNTTEVKEVKTQLPDKIQEIVTNVVEKDKTIVLTRAEKLALNYAPLMQKVTEQIGKYKKLEKGNAEHVEAAKRIRLDCGRIASAAAKQKKQDKDLLLIETRYIDKLFGVVEGAARLTQADAKEIEDHFENLEKERIEALQIERAVELEKYECDPIPGNLGSMEDNIWSNFLAGTKLNYETKIEAEKLVQEQNKLQFERYNECAKYSEFNEGIINSDTVDFGTMSIDLYNDIINRLKIAKEKFEKEEAEKLRIEKLHNDRKEIVLPYWDFVTYEEKRMSFGEVSQDDFNSFLNRIKNAKDKYEKEQKTIREENEKLIKEAKEKDRLAKIEEQKRLDEENKKEEERQKIENERLEKERLERERIQKENDEKLRLEREEQAKKQAAIDAKLKIEREAKEKLEKELEDKRLAEEKAIKEAEETRQAELKKGDSAKFNDMINELESIKTKYSFSNKVNKSKYEDVGKLIDKIINHIK